MNNSDLRILVDDLRDAQRYATNWEVARAEIPKLMGRVEQLCSCNVGASSEAWNRTRIRALAIRIGGNLAGSLDLVVESPMILRGYLAGAAAELEHAIERIERLVAS